jgi:hypothetical protein
MEVGDGCCPVHGIFLAFLFIEGIEVRMEHRLLAVAV